MLEKLQKFGLSEKEAKIYLALLELGTATVSDIAEKAEINRSNTYVLLNSIAERDLVSISERNGYYTLKQLSPSACSRLLSGNRRGNGDRQPLFFLC